MLSLCFKKINKKFKIDKKNDNDIILIAKMVKGIVLQRGRKCHLPQKIKRCDLRMHLLEVGL